MNSHCTEIFRHGFIGSVLGCIALVLNRVSIASLPIVASSLSLLSLRILLSLPPLTRRTCWQVTIAEVRNGEGKRKGKIAVRAMIFKSAVRCVAQRYSNLQYMSLRTGLFQKLDLSHSIRYDQTFTHCCQVPASLSALFPSCLG